MVWSSLPRSGDRDLQTSLSSGPGSKLGLGTRHLVSCELLLLLGVQCIGGVILRRLQRALWRNLGNYPGLEAI